MKIPINVTLDLHVECISLDVWTEHISEALNPLDFH
jgi:hypothetical protein